MLLKIINTKISTALENFKIILVGIKTNLVEQIQHLMC